MRILITNDDGIGAPGLEVLREIALSLSDDVWVVAPETDQSGAAHSLTLHEPLRLRQTGEKRFAVRGTPTDCVIMAVRHLLGTAPDLVLSGVNCGANICDDVTYSGTVAGAIEGTLLGCRSIAMSLAIDYEGNTEPRWQTARELGPDLLRRLLAAGWPAGALLNVNFPDCEPSEVTGIKITEQGRRDPYCMRIEDRMDTRGKAYYWIAFNSSVPSVEKGTDLWAIRHNAISVTPLKLNLTDYEICQKLEQGLDS